MVHDFLENWRKTNFIQTKLDMYTATRIHKNKEGAWVWLLVALFFKILWGSNRTTSWHECTLRHVVPRMVHHYLLWAWHTSLSHHLQPHSTDVFNVHVSKIERWNHTLQASLNLGCQPVVLVFFHVFPTEIHWEIRYVFSMMSRGKPSSHVSSSISPPCFPLQMRSPWLSPLVLLAGLLPLQRAWVSRWHYLPPRGTCPTHMTGWRKVVTLR